jgi:hypothetical protein
VRTSLKCMCALALFLCVHAAAYADPLMDLFTFQVSGLPGTGTASILASPTPVSFVPGVSFDLSNVSATYLGSTFTGDVTFFTAGGAAGQGATLGGDTLFTGLVSDPTFRLGTFSLFGDVDLGDGPMPVSGEVTITQPAVGTVPDPSSLALLGTGALGLVEVVRRRRLSA